ncbi:hypothetical protein DL766_000736 [Monosporascus sp. MC13-8B]|uniref:BRCT domain-containing protein n=1 Tax=Monosporascus cannonballus TaxID=155416 RepID=A0ABY0H8X4_9PEZI|nr:hypothetical protein DL762_004019 [Monosporascus cannonballus]RYO97777.1 hypothetical protein DL763_002573 [Monosporascus cannonballus]RYP38927.1 hypothetical protein DL766_000736 [Monosporascus sp. MC13-8B]
MPRTKKAGTGITTKPIFKDCVVALAGDLGRPGWREADVARWVAAWGGAFSAQEGAGGGGYDSVTHVLASRERFLASSSFRGRLRNRMERAHVVTADWLEDSMTRRRRLPERPYSLREAQRREGARRRRDERAEKGIEKGKRLVNDCLNHVYRDSTFFSYDIKLTRDDEENGNVGQRYRIMLWEFNGNPRHYQLTTKCFRRPGDSQPLIYRVPEETPSLFGPVFAEFKRFFRSKTKIDWDERVAKAGSMPKKYFQYAPPTGGKPVGPVNGEPYSPSIFGDGSSIAVPRNEDSSGDNGNKVADTVVGHDDDGDQSSNPDESGTRSSSADGEGQYDDAIAERTARDRGGDDEAMDVDTSAQHDVDLADEIMMLADAV